MSHRNRSHLVCLFVVWWSIAGGTAGAQTWRDVLGSVAGEDDPQADDVEAVESEPTETAGAQPVDSVEAGFALKEALLIGAENAVAKASRLDGFMANPDIRIPLPPKLGFARETLKRFGLGQEVEHLELAMNRAAEQATAGVLPLLTDAIRELDIEDPLAILGAGGSAATDALSAGSGEDLMERFAPVVAIAAEQTGVGPAYDRLVQNGGALVTQAGVDREGLVPYVTGRALAGLGFLIAAEESAIRTDPHARTTPLLARAFASPPGISTEATTTSEAAAVQPREDETESALKQALEIGAVRAVDLASAADGFLGNPLIRIPMPSALERVSQSLRSLGMGQIVDDFEVSMNRAAEMASAEATPILIDAVRGVSFNDAVAILSGGDSAATDVLRSKTEDSLAAVFEPIITTKMDEAGVTRSYERLMEQAGGLMAMLGGGSDLDLPAYVTDKTLDGLFALIAEEEARIRTDPVARTTDLLGRIFGSLGS